MPYYPMIHDEERLINVTWNAVRTCEEASFFGFGSMYITPEVWAHAIEPPGTPKSRIPSRLASLIGWVRGTLATAARPSKTNEERKRILYDTAPLTLSLVILENEGHEFFTADHEGWQNFGRAVERVDVTAYYTARRLDDAHGPFALLVTLASEKLPEFPGVTHAEVEAYLR